MIEEHRDVAKIWCRGAKASFGSGLLVARNLVLTAKHVVDPAGASALCTIRLMRDECEGREPLKAAVAWKSGKADLALLRIEEGELELEPHYGYSFCSLQHQRPISSVYVTGFPLATRKDRGRKALDYSVEGTLRREGEEGLSFSVPLPDRPSADNDWQGISGAAALVPVRGRTRNLFGVVEEARDQFPNGKLYIASFESLAADRSFEQAYQASAGKLPNIVELNDQPRSLASAEFGFLEQLYDKLGRFPEDAKSPHAFEIDAVRVASFDETKAIVSGAPGNYDRVPPRLLLPPTDRPGERLLLYLQAPGGYGKTSFLRRLMRAAIDEGFVVFHLDPEGRNPSWANLASLFETSTTCGGNFGLFQNAASGRKWLVLLVLDGLNETGVDWRTIQDRLADLQNGYGDGLSIIAADRMNPDRAPPKPFERATLLPVQVERIPDDRLRKLISGGTANRLLSVPFFLDKYYAMQQAGGRPDLFGFGRADIIYAYLREYAPDGAAEPGDGLVERLSKLAIGAYRDGSLSILGKTIDDSITQAAREALCDAGILVPHGEQGYGFAHQLIHDFLAAKWLADQGASAWVRDNFDAVTLGARSFDALELASELLGGRADAFILEVYDWNYKAAMQCILNLDAGLSGKASPLPVQLKDAVFALRAEKLFDRFLSTREAARSKMEGFQSEFGIDFSGLKALDELVAAIGAKYDPGDGELYAQWKELFTLDSVTPAHWALLQDSSLLGWTAANVFRRPGALDKELTAHLVSLYRALRRSQLNFDRGITTRWRIVHALGGASGEQVTRLLTEAIGDGDEDEWVRYGAVRSLVEIAGHAQDRETAHGLLAPLIDGPLLPEKVRREVRDVAMIAENAPAWWPELYGEVLRAGMEKLDPHDREAARERKDWEARLGQLASTGNPRA